MTRAEFDTFCSCHNLSEFIATQSSNQIKKLLKNFCCAINLDLQDFLHNKAITFERNLRSRTYLYIDNEKKNTIIGYFTIAINYLETDKLKGEIIKILDGHASDTKSIPCYLIGQLAVSDECQSKGIGNFLLTDALKIIDESQTKLGGRFVLIDSVNNDKVINFYRENSFVEIEKDKKLKSIKMIKPYFECDEQLNIEIQRNV